MRGTHVVTLTVKVEVEEHDVAIVTTELEAAVEGCFTRWAGNVGPHTVETAARWGAL